MSKKELPKWWEVPMAGVLPASTSVEHKTGDWRVFKPIIDYEKCTDCGLCWVFCPDNAIYVKDGKYYVDYNFCKGCGICWQECPVKAINWVREGEE